MYFQDKQKLRWLIGGVSRGKACYNELPGLVYSFHGNKGNIKHIQESEEKNGLPSGIFL